MILIWQFCGGVALHIPLRIEMQWLVVETLHALKEIVFLVPSALLRQNVYSAFLVKDPCSRIHIIRYC